MSFFNLNFDTPKRQETLPRCGECGLSKKCFSPRMQPTGLGNRKILFIAEAPGAEEDRQGVQLIGEAGKLLRDSLHNIDQELNDCWKTNAVICHPLGGKTDAKQINACRPNLLKTIDDLKPKVIILLGAAALNSLIPLEWTKSLGPLNRWIGHTIPSAEFNTWLCPTNHPSHIIHSGYDPIHSLIFEQHLRAAFQLENVPRNNINLPDLKKQIEIITSPRLARLRLRDLNKQKGLLAFDYEATGLKPDSVKQELVSCAFSHNGNDTFAFMVDQSVVPQVIKVLQNPNLAKIGANIKFEQRWSIAKLEYRVVNWDWDTMIAAHIIDNRSGITSLKFQAYILLGVPTYNDYIDPFLKSESGGINRIREANQNELLLYNGLDAILTFMVSEKQKEILNAKSTLHTGRIQAFA